MRKRCGLCGDSNNWHTPLGKKSVNVTVELNRFLFNGQKNVTLISVPVRAIYSEVRIDVSGNLDFKANRAAVYIVLFDVINGVTVKEFKCRGIISYNSIVKNVINSKELLFHH